MSPNGRRSIRVATRAILLDRDRLLMVNAYPPEAGSDLWCAPGGGAWAHASLPENLIREVHEETGLNIEVGQPALINEFHAPDRDFHQVDIYFRCRLISGQLSDQWRDPQGVVTRARWVTRQELSELRHKPDSLSQAAFGPAGDVLFDPLEIIVR